MNGQRLAPCRLDSYLPGMMDKACIIGAGASGLAAAKVFAERGIPFDTFEMSSDVGGLWRYENDNGRSPAYRSLRTNTSRDKTAYSDFPMPSDYPDYPSHRQMLAYLEAYADRFGLREHVRFRSRVSRVRASHGEKYEVTWRSLYDDSIHIGRYGSVVIASGHHWNPYTPQFSGSFSGREFHSQAYREPTPFAGKRVLVVGIGNSACDIACEVSSVAERTVLSTRRSAHVIPKYLLGRPLDTWLSPVTARLPLPVRRSLFRALIFLERGPQRRYGLRAPDHALGSEHPTISSELLPLVRDGRIVARPDVLALRGTGVAFVDGTEEEFDAIIYATGYLISFPFLDFVDVRANDLPLYHHVVHPEWLNLFFLGLVQPLGALPPLAEAQAEWVADLLDGTCSLPSQAEMGEAIRASEAARRKRYVDSKRHRIEVESYDYLRALNRERREGRRRRAPGVDLSEQAPADERAAVVR